MNQRLLFMLVKLARAMAVGAITVALMAGLPALAADHDSSGQISTANDQNLFARYNTQLSVAASHVLRHVVAHAVAASSIEMARPPAPPGVTSPSPGRNSQLARRRVERLLPVIGPILRKAGIPVQLAAVVLVESGGNPTALSPKGARGLWQLMPDTAREYGLIVNGETDQRLDVVKSTRAAAEYLRDLYAEFGSWKLALAAYNAGDQAVHRAMAQTGGDAFATASSALPTETQNYVPAVYHALAWFGGSALPPPANWAGVRQIAYAVGN